MSLFGAKTTLRGVSHYGAMGAALKNQRSSFEGERLREVGAALKKARESFRLTVEHVATELYVPADRICALESGDWSFTNNEVYARGYLRNYADYLGLDYKELALKIDAVQTPTHQTTATPMLRKHGEFKQDIKHWLMLAMAALFAVIAVVILLMQEQKTSSARSSVEPIPDYLLHYMGTQETPRIFWWGCMQGGLLPDVTSVWECYAPYRYHGDAPSVPTMMHQRPAAHRSPYFMMTFTGRS